MRIGFDVSCLAGEKTGCTWYADSLIRAMVRHHPEHDFLLYHQFGQLCTENASKGITLSGPNVSQPYRDWSVSQARREWAEIEKGRAPSGAPDIIQSNFYECPRVSTVPVVCVVHDLTFWICPEFHTASTYIGLTRVFCEVVVNAAAFIFVSEYTRQDFERHFPGLLKRRNLPHRVIHEAARQGGVGSDGTGNFKPGYWLFVSSIEPRKNLMTLLQAHDAYWNRSASPRKLLLAGGRGWCSEDIHREIAARQAQGRLEYLGYVPEGQMEDLYTNAYAVVYPSFYEGFGLPVLEAMNRGVPVISSRATSLPEVGGEAVDYFDPSSPEELTDRMLALEQDQPSRDRLASAGKKRAEQFSWMRAADETIDFYQEVVAGWKGAR